MATKAQLLEYQERMRTSPTKAEIILAEKLSKIGVEFIQQHIIEPYIVDFYISSKRLAIEVDGAIHKQTQEYDARRDKYLKNLGLKIVRIVNARAFKIGSDSLRHVIAKAKDSSKKGKKRTKATASKPTPPNPSSKRNKIKTFFKDLYGE